METQKFKSVSIREIVDCALHGKPINVQSRELFDLCDVDIDDDKFIVDEYSDPLEIESFFKHVAEENFLSDYENSKSNPHPKPESNSDQKPESNSDQKPEQKPEL